MSGELIATMMSATKNTVGGMTSANGSSKVVSVIITSEEKRG